MTIFDLQMWYLLCYRYLVYTVHRQSAESNGRGLIYPAAQMHHNVILPTATNYSICGRKELQYIVICLS
jgi:hypothetical protein